MNSKLIELLVRGSTPQLRRNVVFTAAVSGVASAAILAIINAAAHAVEVSNLNFRYFAEGVGTPVTAVLNDDGIRVYDPIGGSRTVYALPI